MKKKAKAKQVAWILSPSKDYYSTKKLTTALRYAGYRVEVVDLKDISYTSFMTVGGVELWLGGKARAFPHLVIPRVATAYLNDYRYFYQAARNILRAWLPNPDTIHLCNDKMLTALMWPEYCIPSCLPASDHMTYFAHDENNQDDYVIYKGIDGSKGKGVLKVHNSNKHAVTDALNTLGDNYITQAYMPKGSTDYRIFVIGGKVAAIMRRTAPKGDFRANISLGGKGTAIGPNTKIGRKCSDLAAKVAFHCDLPVFGIDVLEHNDDLKIIELNANPGLEGIEGCTKIDLAKKIVDHYKGK